VKQTKFNHGYLIFVLELSTVVHEVTISLLVIKSLEVFSVSCSLLHTQTGTPTLSQ